jgi:hypothetical protein
MEILLEIVMEMVELISNYDIVVMVTYCYIKGPIVQ